MSIYELAEMVGSYGTSSHPDIFISLFVIFLDYISTWFIAVIDVYDQTNIVDENLHWKCSQSKYTRSYTLKW